MSSYQWFRLYSELLDDPKIQRLSDFEFKCFINALCLASKNGKSTGEIGTISDVSYAFRETESTVSSAFHSLKKIGVIETVGETFHVTKWSKRQYKSDLSTERVKRFRKRKRNVSETAPDTDTDTDTEQIQNTEKIKEKKLNKKKKPSPDVLIPDWIPESDWNDYLEMRAVMKKPMTENAKKLAIKKLAELKRQGHTPSEVLQQSTLNCWQGLFAVKREETELEREKRREREREAEIYRYVQ